MAFAATCKDCAIFTKVSFMIGGMMASASFGFRGGLSGAAFGFRGGLSHGLTAGDALSGVAGNAASPRPADDELLDHDAGTGSHALGTLAGFLSMAAMILRRSFQLILLGGRAIDATAQANQMFMGQTRSVRCCDSSDGNLSMG